MSDSESCASEATSYLTDNTTAEECLEDIDISSYVIADSIRQLNKKIDKFLNKHVYYNTLLKNCEEIAAETTDPQNYFEGVYKFLASDGHL